MGSGRILGGDTMTPKDFYAFHKSIFDTWEHGEIMETWTDLDGNTCIRYDSGAWWHYKTDRKGNIIFW